MIIKLLNSLKECTHEKVSVNTESAYCPDCGAYVENKWYLARCSCCNIKRVSYLHLNKIQPESRYCPNCGCEKYYLEEISNINFIDVNFAVVKKVAKGNFEENSISQIWVNEKENSPLRFLGLLSQ